jgi:methionyl aminopeptidase
MSVEILGPRDIAKLRRASEAAAATLTFVGSRLRAGMTTAQIDLDVREHTRALGGTPSQLGYEGFPAAVCISRNSVVCHGPGDIINIDVFEHTVLVTRDGYEILTEVPPANRST